MHRIVGWLALDFLTVVFVIHLGKASGRKVLSTRNVFTVMEGDSIIVNCTDLSQLKGNITIRWWKNNRMISEKNPYLNKRGNGTYYIPHMRSHDDGIYNCTTTALQFKSTDITWLKYGGKVSESTVRPEQPNPTEPTTDKPNTSDPTNSPTNATGGPSDKQELLILQQQLNELLTSNDPATANLIAGKLVNLTSPSKGKLDKTELTAAVNLLAQLVEYNTKLNNTAFNTTEDRQNVIEVTSNILEEQNSGTWLDLQKEQENVTDELIKTMDDFGSQVGDQLTRNNNSTEILQMRNVAFRADGISTRKNVSMDFPEYGAKIYLPEDAFSGTSTSLATTIVYRTLNDILRLQSESSGDGRQARTNTQRSGSNIVSASIVPRPTKHLENPLKLVLSHKTKSRDFVGKCVFWELSLSERTWQTQGCVRVDLESNHEVTTCECNHLTIFAVLLNNQPVDSQHESNLEYISTIGCTCSLFFICLTFFVIILCWKHVKSSRVNVLLNLCAAIAGSCLLIIIAEQLHLEEIPCLVTTALLHYFLLSIFSWMFCHGLIFYFLIIKGEMKEKLEPKMKWFYLLGWGIPMLIVVASLVITRTENYAAENCWLAVDRWLIYWAFVGPLGVVVTVNTILFITLLCRIDRVRKFKQDVTYANQVRAWLRRAAILLPVLGVTWAFGLLTFFSSTVVFHYVFTVFNSLQGVFIFINYCVLDNTIRGAFCYVMCGKVSTPSRNGATGLTTFKKSSSHTVAAARNHTNKTAPV